MTDAGPDLATILDTAADLVVNDGMDALTFARLARRLDAPQADLESQFVGIEHLLISTLNREYQLMHRTIVDNIDRDPRGGLLSRIYFYILSAVYERPLPRALYMTDPASLNQIMRTVYGMQYQPDTRDRADFIARMRELGMIKDVDPLTVAAMLNTFSAGLAITAPSSDYDLVVKGIEYVLAELVDEDVADTQPGKVAFYEFAAALAGSASA